MTIDKLTRSQTEEPRSTAYYYADLERFKRSNHDIPPTTEVEEPRKLDDARKELKLSLDVKPVLPLRQCSLPGYKAGQNPRVPEYSTPEGRQVETYSTAGTFPLQKEKEPLLAELEVVGRVPLTQLSSTQVRRSRSWYFCCPQVSEEEVSRESSWRYSSLRPVTAPPAARTQNVIELATPVNRTQNYLVGSTFGTAPPVARSGNYVPSTAASVDVAALTAERDSLSRALSLERHRLATERVTHESLVAELHGVIAELVRRREGERAGRIEEGSEDECESTTQPAGDLDLDEDRTEQIETSSALSPIEVSETLQDEDQHKCERTQDCAINVDKASSLESNSELRHYDTSLHLTDGEDGRLTANRCSRGSSCERERGSVQETFTAFAASPGRLESREAKLASRIKLRRTGEPELVKDDSWCVSAVEKLSLEVGADADVREIIANTRNHVLTECCKSAQEELISAKVSRLEGEVTYLTAALHTASDTAARLSTTCSSLEVSHSALCMALRASDRAIEVYDVLLALAESREGTQERASAECVASQLLCHIESDTVSPLGEISPTTGPWADYTTGSKSPPWTTECESRLRAHVSRLKVETSQLRRQGGTPAHRTELDSSDIPQRTGEVDSLEMEKAIMMQEVLEARESRAAALLALSRERALCTLLAHRLHQLYLSSSNRRKSKKEKQRHWLDASETDL